MIHWWSLGLRILANRVRNRRSSIAIKCIVWGWRIICRPAALESCNTRLSTTSYLPGFVGDHYKAQCWMDLLAAELKRFAIPQNHPYKERVLTNKRITFMRHFIYNRETAAAWSASILARFRGDQWFQPAFFGYPGHQAGHASSCHAFSIQNKTRLLQAAWTEAGPVIYSCRGLGFPINYPIFASLLNPTY